MNDFAGLQELIESSESLTFDQAVVRLCQHLDRSRESLTSLALARSLVLSGEATVKQCIVGLVDEAVSELPFADSMRIIGSIEAQLSIGLFC